MAGRKYGVRLLGVTIDEAIPVIPFHDIRRAIALSLPELLSSLPGDERNVLLTLARMWFTLTHHDLTTKDRTALWAMERLPPPLAAIFQTARHGYLGYASGRWDISPKKMLELAHWMQACIVALVHAADSTDDISSSSAQSRRHKPHFRKDLDVG